jgi:hypothetical protein
MACNLVNGSREADDVSLLHRLSVLFLSFRAIGSASVPMTGERAKEETWRVTFPGPSFLASVVAVAIPVGSALEPRSRSRLFSKRARMTAVVEHTSLHDTKDRISVVVVVRVPEQDSVGSARDVPFGPSCSISDPDPRGPCWAALEHTDGGRYREDKASQCPYYIIYDHIAII